MIRSLLLVCVACLVLLQSLHALPSFKGEDEETPGYEINPHFGFRRYFEVRYEPLSEPYVYTPPQPQEYQPPQQEPYY